MIDIIDYAVEDEKDAEGLSGLMDRKSKARFPNSILYGAAGAIMAKKGNASCVAIKKFEK